ncbi:MAG: transcriptional repressor [Elusimicrobia bacterium CG1_02_63_36]|nr:MAG: transcriptional repressor [Elusimicrobia bacterium CG1_02_63_36]
MKAKRPPGPVQGPGGRAFTPRDTPQRRAIRKTIEAGARPLTPNEILDSAKSRHRGLGIATVYRNLKSLVEEGWISEVALPNEAPRYERAGKHHHHHFQCSACRRVFELEGCADAISRISAPDGFSVERHELTLFGRCADC